MRPILPVRRHAAVPVTFLLLLGTLAACTTPPDPDPDRAAVDQALDSVYAAFSEAYARANVQMLMDRVYAPDAFYLPVGSPILEGQDQFRGQFSFLEPYARDGLPGPDIAFDIIDRDVDGDLAYDIGIYTIDSGGPGGQPGRGKFLVVWKRNSQGEWRIHADSFSPLE